MVSVSKVFGNTKGEAGMESNLAFFCCANPEKAVVIRSSTVLKRKVSFIGIKLHHAGFKAFYFTDRLFKKRFDKFNKALSLK